MDIQKKYIHDEAIHNLDAAREIVPVLNKMLKPESVVDVGCGIGTFLFSFKETGVHDVLGMDGSWIEQDLVFKYLKPEEFIAVDLESEIKIQRKFDLALCLEVAEHLKEESSEALIRTLTSLSQVIVFSAAIPFQGGQNHLNEQFIGYWIQKFAPYKYSFYDCLRPVFWNNEKIFWWYRQNIFLVIEDEAASKYQHLIGKSAKNEILDLVHPELFIMKVNEIDHLQKEMQNKLGEQQKVISILESRLSSQSRELNKIISGENSLKEYLDLLIRHLKFVLRQLGILKGK